MRRFNVQDTEQGFTLIEVLVIIIMIGIMSAIAAPSMLGILNRSKVNDALTQVQGTLQQAQRQSIRRSKSCQLTLSANTISGSCLVMATQMSGTTPIQTIDSNVSLRSASSDTNVSVVSNNVKFWFDHKGVIYTNDPTLTTPTPTQLTQPVTLVLSSTKTSTQKCVVLSAPLGLMRAGTYTGATSTTTETNCSTKL